MKPESIYFLIEDLGMTSEQRNFFFNETEADGVHIGIYPDLITSERISIDGLKAIYQGKFQNLNQGKMISRLAQSGISTENNLRAQPIDPSDFGLEIIFEYRSGQTWIPCMRWIVFCPSSKVEDIESTTQFESLLNAIEYLSINISDWE